MPYCSLICSSVATAADEFTHWIRLLENLGQLTGRGAEAEEHEKLWRANLRIDDGGTLGVDGGRTWIIGDGGTWRIGDGGTSYSKAEKLQMGWWKNLKQSTESSSSTVTRAALSNIRRIWYMRQRNECRSAGKLLVVPGVLIVELSFFTCHDTLNAYTGTRKSVAL